MKNEDLIDKKGIIQVIKMFDFDILTYNGNWNYTDEFDVVIGINKDPSILVESLGGPNFGLDEKENILCLDYNKYAEDEVRTMILKFDEVTNISPDIKDHFGMTISKSEVYL